MMSEQDLIVLGGGIVGKTTALTLAQQGLKVLHMAPFLEPKNTPIQSQADQDIWQSRVYAISSSSKKLLQTLQVWDALDQNRLQAVREMRIMGDSGHEKDRLCFSAFEGAVPQLAWMIEAQHIENALDLVSRFAPSLTRLQCEVQNIQLEPGHALVNTSEGHFRAKLVIAADGANSPTREQFSFEMEEEVYPQTAVIANFSCTQPHLQTAYQWFLPGGDILALLPLPGKRVSMVWSTHHDHAKTLLDCAVDDPHAFCARISQCAHGKITHELGKLTLLNAVKSYPLRKLRAKHLIGPDLDPKIVLVGDAAHVMHPLAGQGLNLGLRDIADLSQVIAEKESFRSINDPVLLRRYERMRAGDIDALLQVTHRLHELFLNQAPPVRWLRNIGMRFVNQNDFLKRQLIARALG